MSNDKNAYRESLNLPQTDFPMRAGLPKAEPKWLEKWEQEKVYECLREERAGRDMFILHLGPPYANGHLHMGHALSYVLKDFIVRAKSMAGFNAPYVPGWDCHGLPIEWKVEQGLRAKGKSKNDLSVKELRDLCRAEANQWIATQKAEWQRFGCIGDWEHVYKTMDPANEAGIVREIGRMATKGYLYKGSKSVMWSPVEETALAEAEIEYKDHTSTAVYVAFGLEGKPDEAVVIWTTTPWTLPANKAVAYHDKVDYVGICPTDLHEKAVASKGMTYWVAAELLGEFTNMCGINAYTKAGECTGADFAGQSCRHPFYDVAVPLLHGGHVTTEGGTGFVHIAPAHGADDFYLGLEHGLDTACPVLGDGSYADDVAPLSQTNAALAGRNIWDAQSDIIAEMVERGVLLRWSKHKHSYPHSWRSKQPVIFRTTPQWFVGLDEKIGGTTLRRAALDCIHGENGVKKVKWVPSYGEKRIGSMIANRPDWCISRQRAWGVPITILRNKKSGDYIFNAEVFEHIAALIETGGIDVWEMSTVEELLPEGWLETNGLSADDLEKETDILDVWIDSGTTHAHVMRHDERFQRPENQQKQELRPADMYLEGSDQHRGWFHSSLLTSVASYGDAPYEAVVTHGFVVDGEGKKMSKSVGNVVAPKDLTEKYGMDIVRLWVAASDYAEDVRLSDQIMQGMADSYRRFRNTFRFLLGNLHDFDETQDMLAHTELPALEKYILHRLYEVLSEVQQQYDAYQFHRVYQVLHNFCAVELSSFYFDIRKDSLYCDARDNDTGKRRKAAQTVLTHLLKGLSTHLAPIMPFTADEVWRARFGEARSIHLEEFASPDKVWNQPEILEEWQHIHAVRDAVNIKLEEARSAGIIGASLEAQVTIYAPHGWGSDVMDVNLADILIVSQADWHAHDGEDVRVDVARHNGHKCPRCWMYHEELSENGVCHRCDAALAANKQVAAA